MRGSAEGVKKTTRRLIVDVKAHECYAEAMILSAPWPFDLSVTHAAQTYQPSWLNILANIFSWLGQPEVIVPVVIVVAGWLFYKKQSIRDLTLILIMAGNLLTLIIKDFVQRPRPSPDLVNVLAHKTDFGFPSGHALAAVLTAGAIWIVFRHRRWGWLHPALIVYALAIGWSRLYLGVHWFSDVLAGYIIGLIWLMIILIILPRKQQT